MANAGRRPGDRPDHLATLYRLAERAQVSISNLTVGLRRLGLIYIPEGSKAIYRSKDEFNGQGTLF